MNTHGSAQVAPAATVAAPATAFQRWQIRRHPAELPSSNFTSRDTWEGVYSRSTSLHKYAYTENDPINFTDPSGLKRFRIWAAAFIAPSEIVFPYYDVSRLVIPVIDVSPIGMPVCTFVSDGVDIAARWHGDGRTFSNGERSANDGRARMWHEVIIETDPLKPLVERNQAETGRTFVTFKFADGIEQHRDDKAPNPQPATIVRLGDQIIVTIEGRAHNPLTIGSPNILYFYTLIFDTKLGKLQVVGSHSYFPWHELLVTDDDIGTLERYNPVATFGEQANPGLLALGAGVFVGPKTRYFSTRERQ